MINSYAVYFSERRSEEVISFFWRSVYVTFVTRVTSTWIQSASVAIGVEDCFLTWHHFKTTPLLQIGIEMGW